MSSSTSEDFEIHNTLVNTPHLHHTHSTQSVAASEHYYSLSEPGSNDDNEAELHPPVHRFATPPSRFHTPENAPLSQAERDEKQLRRKAVGSAGPKELAPVAEQKSLAEDKAVSGNHKTSLAMEPSVHRGMTPGHDDSQFIHFAIDQLTRDEEVRGSRHYPVRREEAHSSPPNHYSNYPSIPQHTQDPRREPHNASGIRVVPFAGHPAQPTATVHTPLASPSYDHSNHRSYDDEAGRAPLLRPSYDDEIGQVPRTPDPVRWERERRLAEQKELEAGRPVPQHPLEHHGPMTESSNSFTPLGANDVFVAYDPIRPTTQQPRLNFVPAILRPLWLGLFILLCVLMLIGLLFCAVWCLTHDGLWQYGRFGGARYFVFEYLPALLGMVILMWLIQIEAAVIRVAPFMAMASNSMKARAAAQFLPLYPTKFLMPKLEYFRSGQPVLGVIFTVFWLFLFTIPLLSSAFNVQYFGPPDNGTWRWVAVQGVIWAIIVLYILLIIALLVLLFTLRRSVTGLKWDPRSLADLIALLERANFLNEYTGTEIYSHLGDFRQRLWNSTPRLGYWHTSQNPNNVFYGFGEEGALTRRYSIEQGRIREKGHRHHISIDSQEDVELGDQSRVQLNYRHGVVRRRYLPWFLSSSSVLAWILIAFVLLVAFYVVAFVNRATTGTGFLPNLEAATNHAGFSAANFLYSFIPGLIGFLLFLCWLPLDFAIRRLEPYRTMTTAQGAIAEHSLLLDYPYRLPGSITLAAAINRHWKIAFVSFITLLNTALPILAGGIFWSQWYPGTTEVRVSAEPAALYALCFFLAIYTVSLIAFAPGRNRLRMPHESKCLAEIISWLYQSPLLMDRAFARCQSKTELQTKLLGERAALQGGGFWASVTQLVHSFSREGMRAGNSGSSGARGGTGESAALNDPRNHKAKAVLGEEHLDRHHHRDDHHHHDRTAAEEAAEKRSSLLSAEMARYAFGVYTGRDGRDHLGFDRVGRGLVLFDD